MWGIEHLIAIGALICNMILTALALWRACQTKAGIDLLHARLEENPGEAPPPSSSSVQFPAHTASRRR
jgi:hypothetical protein